MVPRRPRVGLRAGRGHSRGPSSATGSHSAIEGAPGSPEEKPEAPSPEGGLWRYDFEAKASTKICDVPKDGLALGVPLEWAADSSEVGFVVSDPGCHGRAIGCLVAARPNSPVREVVKGLTEEAAWAPGLKGLAFLEERDNDQVVLIYKGLTPRTLRALGELPHPQGESSGSIINPLSRSLPAFSHDGRKIAVMVGEGETAKVVVFEAP